MAHRALNRRGQDPLCQAAQTSAGEAVTSFAQTSQRASDGTIDGGYCHLCLELAARAFAQTMTAYALTPLAKADIFDIWSYIAVAELAAPA